MFSLPHSVYVWVCVCFICVCVTLDGGGDCMLWIFLSRTFFLMFIQNEYIPPSVWHQPPCFSKCWKKWRHAPSVCINVCVCWGGYSSGTNYQLTPLQTGHKATRVQGRKGSAAAVLFPSLRAPWGARGGSDRVGFDGICWCLLLETLTKSLQLRLSMLHHHKQCQLERNDLLNFSSEVMHVRAERCERSDVWCFI